MISRFLLVVALAMICGYSGCAKKSANSTGDDKTADKEKTAANDKGSNDRPKDGNKDKDSPTPDGNPKPNGDPAAPNNATTHGDLDAVDKLDVSYISDNFAAAVVLHPGQISQSPLVMPFLRDKFIQSEFLRKTEIEYGFDPRALEQVVLLIAPPFSPETFNPPAHDDTPRIPGLPPRDDAGGDRADEADSATQPEQADGDQPSIQELFGEEPAAPGAPAAEPANEPKTADEVPADDDTAVGAEPNLDDLFFGLEPAREDDAAEAFAFDPSPTPQFAPVAENLGVVLRFSDAADAESFLSRYRLNLKEQVFESRTYFRDVVPLAPPPGEPREVTFGPLSMYLADERTVLVAAEATLRKMMLSKNAENPLSDRLRTAPAVADAVAAMFVPPLLEDRRFRQILVGRGAAEDENNPVLQDFEQLQSMTMSIRFSHATFLQVRVEGADGVSSEELLQRVTGRVGITNQVLDALIIGFAEAISDDVRPVLALSHLLVGDATIKMHRDDVVVDVPAPSAEELTTTLNPLIAVIKERFGRPRRIAQLQQIASALAGYTFDYEGHFPAEATYDANGKPLLSWRVQILPYLGYERLYDEFHLNEPWDSPHNIALLDRMPEEFGDEGSETRIVVFAGGGTPFDGTEGLTRTQISDGLSNTIFCIRAGADKRVTWTKPADLSFVADAVPESIGAVSEDGFEALFFDFRVRVLPKDIDPDHLRRLIDPADGEPVELRF